MNETAIKTIRVGQTYTFGSGPDAERGRVASIVGDQVTVQWEQGTVTTQSAEALGVRIETTQTGK